MQNIEDAIEQKERWCRIPQSDSAYDVATQAAETCTGQEHGLFNCGDCPK